MHLALCKPAVKLKPTKDGDIVFLRQRFEGICPPLSAVLKLATKCDRWKIAQMPNLPRWTSKSGRAILLGDAAHAMQPNAAQVCLTSRLEIDWRYIQLELSLIHI